MNIDEDFGFKIDPVAELRSVLQGYPFSNGLPREFVQNAEDAKATKMVRLAFLLTEDLRLMASRFTFWIGERIPIRPNSTMPSV